MKTGRRVLKNVVARLVKEENRRRERLLKEVRLKPLPPRLIASFPKAVGNVSAYCPDPDTTLFPNPNP